MWPCQQPSAPRPGFLGRRLRCASIRRACAGSLGPRSPRSADGPVIIISRPVLPDHFLAPWTAVSLASLRRRLKSHFSSVLYFAHSINLDCDPAPGSVHLCLASGRSSPEGCFFPRLFRPLFYFIQGLKLSKKKKPFGLFYFNFPTQMVSWFHHCYQIRETFWRRSLVYSCKTVKTQRLCCISKQTCVRVLPK